MQNKRCPWINSRYAPRRQTKGGEVPFYLSPTQLNHCFTSSYTCKHFNISAIRYCISWSLGPILWNALDASLSRLAIKQSRTSWQPSWNTIQSNCSRSTSECLPKRGTIQMPGYIALHITLQINEYMLCD